MALWMMDAHGRHRQSLAGAQFFQELLISGRKLCAPVDVQQPTDDDGSDQILEQHQRNGDLGD